MNPKYKRLPWKTRAFLGTFVSSLKAGHFGLPFLLSEDVFDCTVLFVCAKLR